MGVAVHHARHEEVTPTIQDASVDLVLTDPPYFRVKDLAWDRQWDNEAAFLAWMGTLADEWARILKPTGSLYVFASPQMAARVEALVRERFRVLNHVVWLKSVNDSGAGRHMAADRTTLRSYFPRTERIIFAEPYGDAGPGAKATADIDVRMVVFQQLRAWLRAEVAAAGLNNRQVNEIVGSSVTGGGMAAHYTGATQWELPTEAHYAKLAAACPGFFTRPHADLRAEYDRLQVVYEARRRVFNGDTDHFTDVWDIPSTLKRGRHPCEKPPALAQHIVATSSRPGDLVFDGFCGSGAFGIAAARLGRRFIGCDADATWADRARAAITGAVHLLAPTPPATATTPIQLALL